MQGERLQRAPLREEHKRTPLHSFSIHILAPLSIEWHLQQNTSNEHLQQNTTKIYRFRDWIGAKILHDKKTLHLICQILATF